MDYERRSDECLNFFTYHRGESTQLNYLEVNECVLGTFRYEYEGLGVQVVPVTCVDCDDRRQHEESLRQRASFLTARQTTQSVDLDAIEDDEEEYEESDRS